MPAKTHVLIAGAGPTGLVLALWLAKSGLTVRIIDTTNAPGTTSRAILFHARNLEFYDQMGIAQPAVERGVEFSAVNLWRNGGHVGRISFADLGAGVSPYPYVLIFPQDQQEQLLIEQLAALGVHVERNRELLSFTQTADGVQALVKDDHGDEQRWDADYLAGCDGAHSRVREVLGVGFPGGGYDDLYYVADIEAEGAVANGEMHGALDDAEFLAIFPMKGRGRVRLVGQVLPRARQNPHPSWPDVRGVVIEHLPLQVEAVRWFSTYHVGHRVAESFRGGRVFLLGDAAHIHSPVGGQGMNTGIGDAVNLAWKLAAVVRGHAGDAILDTYETERIAFARALVRTTDRAFQFVSARGPIAKRVRLAVVPIVVPFLFRFRAVRRLLFRTLSQTAIRYPQSALSAGKAGRVRAGDRLPWIPLAGQAATASERDNFASLRSRDWQVHVYGRPSRALNEACAARGLALHAFAWGASMRRAGVRRDAVYLIRPDGYVAFADRTAVVASLARYLDDHRIQLN
jgi:2-polyprenyl-6-methoxyphenol hydroxylase-like FAD-dependent oxidoreductase